MTRSLVGRSLPRGRVLFICTGNYYRSRFAEYYFEHLAARAGLDWTAISRGTEPSSLNPGPLSPHTVRECRRLEIPLGEPRYPVAIEEADLVAAEMTIALKEEEHREPLRRAFPVWEPSVEYWTIDDIDCAQPHVSLAHLATKLDELVERLGRFGRSGADHGDVR